MNTPLSLRIGNSNADIASALDQTTGWLEKMEIPAEARFFPGLAIEELATNWIKYGCSGSSKDFMTLELFHRAGTLTLIATDTGAPFNPLDMPPPLAGVPLEQREPGGLGILLLRKMADRMSYERRDEQNIVTLEKSTIHTQA
jgi:anti-sigma regulatory factor (Ser/Thr protein kinase)